MKKLICTALTTIALAAPFAAFAQDKEKVASEELEKKALAERKEGEDAPKDGWEVTGKLGFSGSFTNARNFVGAEEGTTIQLGIMLGIDTMFRDGQHGWENQLKLQHAQTKTPNLESFVKSADQLDLKSTYTYRFMNPDWMGVFGRFKLGTQILNSYSVRAEPATYITPDVPAGSAVGAQEKIRLTGPFEPLILRESAGAFAKPIEEEKLKLKTSLGLAAQHVIVRDGRVIANVDESGAVDVVTLEDMEGANDLGVELTLNAEGLIVKEVLSWNLTVDLFQPLFPSDDERSIPDRLNLDLIAGLSLKLAKWLSLDYVLTIRRIPVVVDEFQIQNQLLLTAGFDII